MRQNACTYLPPLGNGVAPKKKKMMVAQERKVMNFVADETAKRPFLAVFLKFEVADSRQTFRAARFRFYNQQVTYRKAPTLRESFPEDQGSPKGDSLR